VDLNLAVVAAGGLLVEKTRVDPIVASLFHLPFANESFDHVTCQGVLHHTWSTQEGFARVSAKVAPNGTLFIWVYAAEDAFVVHGLRGLVVKLYWGISHLVFRPLLSRSPGWFRTAIVTLISCLLHPILARRGRNRERWTFANTVHGIRDAFTPRYAHQLGFNEVAELFENAGYEVRLQSPAAYRKDFGSRILGVGMIGRRLRRDG
jgi:SAM-dependent methyltransferase